MNFKRGILIEGVSGIGKTSILKNLRRLLVEERPGSTTIFFSEHYTERVLEDQRARGTLTYCDIVDHIEYKLTPLLEGACALQQRSKFAGRTGNGMIHIILERWLGGMFSNLYADGVPFPSNAVQLKGRVDANFRKIIDLGIRPVILTLPSNCIENTIRGTIPHRNDAWSAYIDRIDQQHGLKSYFSTWQSFLVEQYTPLNDTYYINIKPSLASQPSTLYNQLAQEIYALLTS